jgi:hypothetical protein
MKLKMGGIQNAWAEWEVCTTFLSEDLKGKTPGELSVDGRNIWYESVN